MRVTGQFVEMLRRRCVQLLLGENVGWKNHGDGKLVSFARICLWSSEAEVEEEDFCAADQTRSSQLLPGECLEKEEARE